MKTEQLEPDKPCNPFIQRHQFIKGSLKFLYKNVRIYFYIMQICQQQYKANESRMARAHSMLVTSLFRIINLQQMF